MTPTRKTPIAFLYRLLWVYLPNGIAWIDSRLLGGWLVRAWSRSGSYILHENHPLVLVSAICYVNRQFPPSNKRQMFFIGLLMIGEGFFLPVAWPRMSSTHHFWVPGVVILPYVLLYKSVVTKSFVTSENHAEEMKRYPYDRVLFHPGHLCSTCEFLKPARSKHCSLCQACVSRHDHHCVWLMNCVGANNYKYFLSLLLAVSILLIYGTLLGYSLMWQTLREIVPLDVQAAMKSWSMYLHVWSIVITRDPKIGTVTLLMLMTAPLAVAFLAYHTYLIWAGMTTNESAKWADWKEDVADGFVFKAKRSQIQGAPSHVDLSDHPWPVQSDQILVTGGQPPLAGYILEDTSNRVSYRGDPNQFRPIDPQWVELHSIRDLDNLYDMGFRRNLKDALGLNVR